MDDKTRQRSQFILASMLVDARDALLRLSKVRPKIFRRNLQKILFEHDNSRLVGSKLDQAIASIHHGNEIDWEAIEEVGLSGPMLEWKADLFYRTLGKPKPQETQSKEILSYPEAKPVWGRLFKYLKSLFGSLIEAVEKDSRLRLVLDFIKEYIECLDASVKFAQGAGEATE
jgi:hypothetical protein